MSYRFEDSFRAVPGWNCSSILVLLESYLAESKVNKLLKMDRGTVRNMSSFMPKLICEISASSWFYCKVICYDARSHQHKIPTLLFVHCCIYQNFQAIQKLIPIQLFNLRHFLLKLSAIRSLRNSINRVNLVGGGRGISPSSF
jgi:hypothetical protein